MCSGQRRKFYAERLRELQQLGFDIPFGSRRLQAQPSEVIVEQCGFGVESPILDLPDGRTLYLVPLSLAAETAGVCIYDFRLVPPWPDQGFQRLPSFAESHIGQAYILPGKWEYPREEVLNLRFEKTGWRLPCARVEGWLAALSDTSIPEKYHHGSPIPVRLEFFGKSGRQLGGTTVTFCADRLTHHGRRVQQSATPLPGKPPLPADNSAQLHNPAVRSHSGLWEGSEVTDSRAANLLPAKEPRTADPGRRSRDHRTKE